MWNTFLTVILYVCSGKKHFCSLITLCRPPFTGGTLAITGTYLLVTFAPHTSTHITAHLVQYYFISWHFLLYLVGISSNSFLKQSVYMNSWKNKDAVKIQTMPTFWNQLKRIHDRQLEALFRLIARIFSCWLANVNWWSGEHDLTSVFLMGLKIYKWMFLFDTLLINEMTKVIVLLLPRMAGALALIHGLSWSSFTPGKHGINTGVVMVTDPKCRTELGEKALFSTV